MKSVQAAVKRMSVFLLAVILLTQPLTVNAAEVETALTPEQAVSEMTWGANFPDLFIADVDYSHGNPIGYHDTAPFGIAIWFWDMGFEWLSYIDQHFGTYEISVPIPTYDANGSIATWINGLFQVGVMSYTKDQQVQIRLSDTKIVKSDGSEESLSFMNGSYNVKTANDPGGNNLYQSILNYNTEGISPGSDLDGAVLRATVTVNSVPFVSPEAKAAYFYQLHREKMDAEELTDVFLAEGANVFRLPITWTSFINDETFVIDECWLQAVQKEVDYILSKGAYCIINMHNDYSMRSYVGGEVDQWEKLWMAPEHEEYVNARFAAVWTQIANYFKDYSDHLIFEPFNEPVMEYVPDYEGHFQMQLERVNELNKLFVETIRATGGKNETRLLCLAVANYNHYNCLNNLELPEDRYLMVQLHSYQEMEVNDPSSTFDSNFDYQPKTETLFDTVDAWKEAHPGIPVIIGEVGVTHKGSDENMATRVAYYFQRAEESGVPCLWWEDFFQLENLYQYWLYHKKEMYWGRPSILQAIHDAVGGVKLSIGGSNYWVGRRCTAPCTVYAAVYDTDGRMLEIETEQWKENQSSAELTFEIAAIPSGGCVKAMILDANHRPVYDAVCFS